MSCSLCSRRPPTSVHLRLTSRSRHTSTARSYSKRPDGEITIVRRRASRPAEGQASEAGLGSALGEGSTFGRRRSSDSPSSSDDRPVTSRRQHLFGDNPFPDRYRPPSGVDSEHQILVRPNSVPARKRPRTVLRRIQELSPEEIKEKYRLNELEWEHLQREGYLPEKPKVTRRAKNMIDVMQIGFLGTSAGSPNTQRNVSCTVLRMDADVWLFDCGEGSWRQFMRTSFKAHHVRKIFITHLHADHVLGLVSMLIQIGNVSASESEAVHGHPFAADTGVIDIYGPPGLRTLLRTTFAVTQCSTMYRFWRIHELHGFPSSRSTPSRYTHDPRGVQGVERGEAKGEDLWCGGSGRSRTGEEAKEGEEGEEGVWKVIEGDGQGGETGVSVEAVAIDHTIDCVGYIIREPPRREKFNMNHYGPMLEEHAAEIIESGYKPPRKILSTLEKDNEPIVLPSGFTISPPPLSIPGRTVVILGDTSNASRLLKAFPPGSPGPDLLIHEATGTALPAATDDFYPKFASTVQSSDLVGRLSFNSGRSQSPSRGPDSTFRELFQLLPNIPIPPAMKEAEARERMHARGHSTSNQAGELAGRIGAHRLIMNHISGKAAVPWADYRPPLAGLVGAPDSRGNKPKRLNESVHENNDRYPVHPSGIQLESSLKDIHAAKLPRLTGGLRDFEASRWVLNLLWSRAMESEAEAGYRKGLHEREQTAPGDEERMAHPPVVAAWDFLTVRLPKPDTSPRSRPQSEKTDP